MYEREREGFQISLMVMMSGISVFPRRTVQAGYNSSASEIAAASEAAPSLEDVVSCAATCWQDKPRRRMDADDTVSRDRLPRSLLNMMCGNRDIQKKNKTCLGDIG